MNMEPHIIVLTRQPFCRAAALLREAGYFVTKIAPEHAGDTSNAEALVVDLRLFDLMQWMEQRHSDDTALVITPTGCVMKGISARSIRTNEVEDGLVSAVDRIVANGRTAALRAS
jgi:hypothetical protein